MREYIVDTSFLVALMVADDVHSRLAQEQFLKANPRSTIYVPHTVIYEACVAFSYLEVLKFIHRLGMYLLEPDITILNQFSHITQDTRLSLKSNDCQILAICLDKGAKLLSFDKKLQTELATATETSIQFYQEKIAPNIITPQ